MTLLPSLPTELICQILGYLQPTTELHEYDIPEEQRWDVRHWGRAIAAVARTCRTLRATAMPLLYSRYEAAFHNPVVSFIDRFTAGDPRHRGLTHVAIRTDGTTNDKYTLTPERLSQYRVWTSHSELESYMLKTITSEEAGQIELWRLISQAPNLESLSVTSHEWVDENTCSHEQPPVWMLPIVSAVQSVREDLKYSGWFQKLHTLSFEMQGQCGTWLIHLLQLPCLKSLTLGSWGIQPYADWEASLVWPEPTAASRVRHLRLWDASVPADVIARIMDYCAALESFKCGRTYDNRVGADVRGRQWCVEILAGLQRHSQTLVSLSLDPSNKHSPWHLKNEYAPVQGFQTLTALESLETEWHVIMGSPSGVDTDLDPREPVNDFSYPSLCSVLPKSLRYLKIRLANGSIPDCTGVREALCSALTPSDTEDDGTFLEKIELHYRRAHYNNPPPMDFWRLQNFFHNTGTVFEYKLRLDPHDFYWVDDEGRKYNIARFAESLAEEGPVGVQIALRTDIVGLPGKVMELLGLGKEWLDTKESKEVLFGEKVGGEAFRG